MTKDTRTLADELHNAYRDGDGEHVAALIHDDIDWCIYGPDHVFSFEGPRRGKAQVMEVLATIGFADGRAIEFKEFSDTFDVVQQALGASLHVPAIAV